MIWVRITTSDKLEGMDWNDLGQDNNRHRWEDNIKIDLQEVGYALD
jgi:hypothetical protein